MRYFATARKPHHKDRSWSPDYYDDWSAQQPTIDVYDLLDPEPVDTGLLDQFENPIYRVEGLDRVPMGFQPPIKKKRTRRSQSR